MIRVATDFVSDSCDSSGSISEADTIGGEIEYEEENRVVIF